MADRRDKITIPESRICPNCSSPEQHSNFCTNCGVEITPEPDSTSDKPASDEDEIINQEPRTFLNCSPTELNCKNCGFNMENQNDRNFCTSCGFPVPLKLNTPMPALAKAIFPVSATVIVGLVILGIRWLHSNSEFPQDAIGGSCGAIGCVAHGDIFFLMIGGLGIAIAYWLSKQLGQALATMPMAGQVVFLGTILAIISILIFGLLRTIELTEGEPVPVGFYSLAALAFGFASVLIAYFFSNKQDWSSSKYVLAFLLGILPSVLFIAPCVAG